MYVRREQHERTNETRKNLRKIRTYWSKERYRGIVILKDTSMKERARFVPATWCRLLLISSLLKHVAAQAMCTLCADRSPVPQSFRETVVPILEQHLGSVGATCADWEAEVAVDHTETSADCSIVRRLSSGVCGCAALQEERQGCYLCAGGQNISDDFLDRPVPFIQGWYGGIEPTCQDWDWLLRGVYEEGDKECTEQRVFSNHCGCSYFNFKTDLWLLLTRISGSISLVCSGSLLVYILKDKMKRSSIYHQIILGISSCDFISSIFFVLADITAPPDDPNASFCKAQGFFLQLGFAAMFYNVSLTLFYMLTIAEGYRESRIRQIQIYLLGLPFGLGLILACAGIPMYVSIGSVCWLPSIFLTDVFGASPMTTLFFGVVPICIAIATITLMQGRIFWFVRQSEQKMVKWRFSRRKLDGNTKISMTEREKKVFWQSAMYVLSFYITWPIVLTSLLVKPDRYENPLSVAYNVQVAAAFLWPLQGFFTFTVYFRPRIMKFLSRGCSRLKPSKKPTENLGSSNCDPPIANEEGAG